MRRTIRRIAALVLCSTATLSCGSEEQPLKVIVRVPAISISKLPVVLAMDHGLYAKHGLDVEMWVPSPGAETTSVYADPFTKLWRMTGINAPQAAEINVDGATPQMVRWTESIDQRRRIAIGATDCVVRAHIIGRKGLTSLDELKGKRLGVSSRVATTGFKALLFAQRMGWDPVQDISIMTGVDDNIEALLDGSVDAIIGYEEAYVHAKKAGLPILADTREWGEFVAGNSISVDPKWLEDPAHREAARRFLKATAEATALYFQQPELAKQAIQEWYGTDDKEFADTIYARGAWLSRKPYPCYEGYVKTMELYDSNEMRRYKPKDFYDDSLMREIDESGFIDALYK